NRNPVNYFAEVEQAAFSPGHLVPGIAPSPDKMLQGRLFSYPDTHRHRLGPNYQLLPVNAARGTEVHTYQRDGFMRFDDNGGAAPNYYPNSFGGPEPRKEYAPPPIPVAGEIGRFAYTHPNDDYVQAGDLYRKVMTEQDRTNLVGNIVAHLGNAQARIQLRQAAIFYKADEEYGTRVAEGLGLDVSTVRDLAEMSDEERVRATAEDVARVARRHAAGRAPPTTRAAPPPPTRPPPPPAPRRAPPRRPPSYVPFSTTSTIDPTSPFGCACTYAWTSVSAQAGARAYALSSVATVSRPRAPDRVRRAAAPRGPARAAHGG